MAEHAEAAPTAGTKTTTEAEAQTKESTMTVNGPEFPQWLVKFVDKIPEPGPKALSTVYGLMIFSVLVRLLASIMMAMAAQ